MTKCSCGGESQILYRIELSAPPEEKTESQSCENCFAPCKQICALE